MNIIFAGTPLFAERHLQALIDSEHSICAVYTQPDRPAGRGKKLQASPVKQLALEHGIAVFQPVSLKAEEAQAELAALNADLMVVVAYGLLLPKIVLETPKFGCINVHGSILPRWRGAAPIQRAIEAGDTETGVTIMQMDIGLDTGDMLVKAYCDISNDDTSASLHDKLAELGPPALLETLKQLENNSLSPEKQNDQQSNYAAKILKNEALINWSETALELDRKIRAFQPFPVCYSFVDGQRVKIHSAKLSTKESVFSAEHANGSVCVREHGLLVKCGDGQLEIRSLQLPGKKAMSAEAYLNGCGGKLGFQRFEQS